MRSIQVTGRDAHKLTRGLAPSHVKSQRATSQLTGSQPALLPALLSLEEDHSFLSAVSSPQCTWFGQRQWPSILRTFWYKIPCSHFFAVSTIRILIVSALLPLTPYCERAYLPNWFLKIVMALWGCGVYHLFLHEIAANWPLHKLSPFTFPPATSRSPGWPTSPQCVSAFPISTSLTFGAG